MVNSILICIPTRGFIYFKIANFISKMAGMGFQTLYSSSSYGTEAARKKLTNTFLKFDYTHLFFLDDDVLPPNDAIAKLLSADADIVSADYLMYDGLDVTSHCSVDNIRVGAEARGLQSIDACGLGACLIKRQVIEKCKDDFGFKFEAGEVVMSEDYWFCEKAKAKGFQLFCDFDIKCEHFKMIPLKGGE